MGIDFVRELSLLACPSTETGQMKFLDNLVKVFPSLKTRPLYLTGQSYAGTYIVCV